MTAQSLQILFPAGRLVQGSLYIPQEKDKQGNPILIKRGPNVGKPTKKYFFALAIAKAPGETHWGYTAWGSQILAHGRASWPQGQSELPNFAWKIDDGDSTALDENMRRVCDHEGFPGNWIVKFSSGFPPKIVTSAGDPLETPNAVKKGFYIGVLGTVLSNEEPSKPGMYVNHNGVAYLAPGTEILTGPDLRAAGFDKLALPPGVTGVPQGTFPNVPPLIQPGHLPVSGTFASSPSASAPPPPATAPAPVAVRPAPSFTQPPAPPGAAAPPPPPASAGPQMTAKANGMSYAQFIAAGWNDAALRKEGYLI